MSMFVYEPGKARSRLAQAGYRQTASHTNATSKMYENDIRDTISPVAWLTGQPDSFEHALNMT